MSRAIHKIDASGKVVGRLASSIAILLRGKNKVTFQPHIDDGDIVEISNVSKMMFTGKKLEQRKLHHYTGYPGGLKTQTVKELMVKNPEKVLREAVSCMLPKNSFRPKMLKRLHFIK